MIIEHKALRMNNKWHACVILDGCVHIDAINAWEAEHQACQAARLMAERLACSLRNQLRANHFLEY